MRIPNLCQHARGRAYATDPATGKQVWFGLYGTPEAKAAYDRWVVQLVSRRADVASGTRPNHDGLLLSTLAADYLTFAGKYYVKRGKQTSEVLLIERAVREMIALYPDMEASAFGPIELKAVREQFVAADWNLDSTNKQIAKLIRMFRWGVENELVRPDQLTALKAVKPLSPGRCSARVPKRIMPVPSEDVRKAAAVAFDPTKTMLLVHLATGMRTGELIDMNVRRIVVDALPWVYVPETHKSEHRGTTRTIYLGPTARELLTPVLLRARGRSDGCLWIGRKGPIEASGYWTEVKRAIRVSGVPRFRPLQIRHTAGTIFRKAAGIEGAQALLGHEHLSTSEIYSERRDDLAASIIEKIG